MTANETPRFIQKDPRYFYTSFTYAASFVLFPVVYLIIPVSVSNNPYCFTTSFSSITNHHQSVFVYSNFYRALILVLKEALWCHPSPFPSIYDLVILFSLLQIYISQTQLTKCMLLCFRVSEIINNKFTYISISRLWKTKQLHWLITYIYHR